MTIAYMGFNKEIKEFDDLQLKIGWTYSLDNDYEIYYNGFHFYKNIIDLDEFYDLDTCRILEVEILGKEAIDEYDLFVTDKFKVIKELSREEIILYLEKEKQIK